PRTKSSTADLSLPQPLFQFTGGSSQHPRGSNPGGAVHILSRSPARDRRAIAKAHSSRRIAPRGLRLHRRYDRPLRHAGIQPAFWTVRLSSVEFLNSFNMKLFATITVIGRDKTGVIARITQFLFQQRANIEALEEQVTRGQFSMTLQASWPAKGFDS